METGERIRKLREDQGLSRVEFAYRIGRTPSFLAQLENGTSGFSEQTIQNICRIFGVRYEWLLSGQGSMYEDGRQETGRFMADREETGLPARVKTIRGIMKMNQQQFADYLKCSKIQIAKVETGKGKASDRWLEHVADKCGISLMWLRSGEGKMEDREEGQNFGQLVNYLRSSEKARKVLKMTMREKDSVGMEKILLAEYNEAETMEMFRKESREEKAEEDARLFSDAFGIPIEQVRAVLKERGNHNVSGKNQDLEKEMTTVCNLGEGIARKSRDEGMDQLAQLISKLCSLKKYQDVERASNDPEYRQKLLRDYGFVKA